MITSQRNEKNWSQHRSLADPKSQKSRRGFYFIHSYNLCPISQVRIKKGRARSQIPKALSRWVRRMLWSIVLKAALRSCRVRMDTSLNNRVRLCDSNNICMEQRFPPWTHYQTTRRSCEELQPLSLPALKGHAEDTTSGKACRSRAAADRWWNQKALPVSGRWHLGRSPCCLLAVLRKSDKHRHTKRRG